MLIFHLYFREGFKKKKKKKNFFWEIGKKLRRKANFLPLPFFLSDLFSVYPRCSGREEGDNTGERGVDTGDEDPHSNRQVLDGVVRNFVKSA